MYLSLQCCPYVPLHYVITHHLNNIFHQESTSSTCPMKVCCQANYSVMKPVKSSTIAGTISPGYPIMSLSLTPHSGYLARHCAIWKLGIIFLQSFSWQYPSHTRQTGTKLTKNAKFSMNRPAVGHWQCCWRHRKTSRVPVGVISDKIWYGIARFETDMTPIENRS